MPRCVKPDRKLYGGGKQPRPRLAGGRPGGSRPQRFYPAYKRFGDIQVPKSKIGGHPWQHIKYYQWLTGGNGGLVSVKGQTVEQVGVLTAADRQAIRKALTDLGIPLTQAPEDEFIVGVENARRGMAASTFANRPFYR